MSEGGGKKKRPEDDLCFGDSHIVLGSSMITKTNVRDICS